MDDQTELLQKIIDILTLIAEPQIAQRDEKPRVALQQIVGKNQSKRKAVMVMDGSRSQIEISQAVSIDRSDLSKLVKALRADGLLLPGEKPQLKIPLPANFFEAGEGRS